MHKLKLKISGMHCDACAKTIEENLTKTSGVFNAKVNHDSQKAVIVYDEQKVNWQKISQVIKGAGDFEAEKISDISEQILTEAKAVGPDQTYDQPSNLNLKLAKMTFIIGILAGVSIISLGLNIYLGTNLFKSSASASGNSVLGANNTAPSLPSAPTPQPQPTAPAKIQTFNITKADHVRGNFNAPVTLVEFSDFECPFCGRIYPTLKKILADYPNKVRLVYKYFPLTSIHPNAQKASEAAECASEQGKFWEYHDKLFDNQAGGYSIDKFKTWAKDLGLNTTKFNDCLDTSKYAAKVSADQQEGQAKGVQGTPATFVNGQLVSGALPYESFKQIIDNLK